MKDCKCLELRKSTTSKTVKQENLQITIENIPCLKCPICGTSYIIQSVEHKVNQTALRMANIASKLDERVIKIDYH